jgi:hypothetical protein
MVDKKRKVLDQLIHLKIIEYHTLQYIEKIVMETYVRSNMNETI